jgi:hypothetical protein
MREKLTDDAGMNQLRLLIWSVLIIIWVVYGTVVIDALMDLP